MSLERISADRYIDAVRTSSSRPLRVASADGREWLLKLRSTGHGVKALVAEILTSGLARAIGLDVPDLAIVHFDGPALEAVPGDELREAAEGSRGDVVGVAWMPGAWVARPVDLEAIPRATKAKIAWLDALVENMDRTTKNPNLLCWKSRVWPIDHGIAFPFHFAEPPDLSPSPFTLRPDHLFGDALGEFDGRAMLTRELIARVVADVPSEWAPDRSIYVEYIRRRLTSSSAAS
jgi:hypothetical protein